MINVAAQSQVASRVSYEFEADGERVRASYLVAHADASHMIPGEQYGVLFAPADASNTTIVYG